jgi:PAS domain S-box-containing protein
MPRQAVLSKSPLNLRERAETALRASRTDVARMSADEIMKLVHELQVHQIELKLQNEELRQSQMELAESRDRFNDLYDFAPVGYLTLDRDAKVLQANLTVASLLGVGRRDLIGRKFSKFVASDSHDALYLHQQTALESGTKQICDLILRRADGVLFPAQIETIYAEDPSTRARECRSTISDITARKQAEEALQRSYDQLEKRVRERTAELSLANATLRESEARKAAMLNASLDGIITIEQDGRILEFNPAAEQIFGYRRDEVVGKKLIVPPALQGRRRKSSKRSLVTDEGPMLGRRIEMIAMRRHGSEFPVELTIVRVGDRQPSMFMGFVRDITDRARAGVEAKARTRQDRSVADLSREALAGRDLGWLLHEAVVVVARVLGIEFAKVLELTPDGEQFLLRAGVGWAEGCVGASLVPARGDSQASYTLQKGEPVLVEDLAKETRFRAAALLRDHSVVSGMSVVIHGRGQPYGVLSAHTARKRRFSIHEAHFLQSIADVLAEALVRRQLEEELLAIANREQLRIGQDLHDGLCQHLAGIEFRTEVLVRKLASDPDAREEAEKIGALLRDGVHQARILSRGLAPVELEANGLMSALAELAASCGELYRITCDFRCDRPVLIAAQNTATHLYRIAQEAISNAVRHGRAKKITIELQHGDTEAVLAVTNDGAPLPATPGRSGGMGLHIMRYRAAMIGATLSIVSTAEGKTAVICSFKSGR